jgi:hypothetical protein
MEAASTGAAIVAAGDFGWTKGRGLSGAVVGVTTFCVSYVEQAGFPLPAPSVSRETASFSLEVGVTTFSSFPAETKFLFHVEQSISI